jgi:hypothetical protein
MVTPVERAAAERALILNWIGTRSPAAQPSLVARAELTFELLDAGAEPITISCFALATSSAFAGSASSAGWRSAIITWSRSTVARISASRARSGSDGTGGISPRRHRWERRWRSWSPSSRRTVVVTPPREGRPAAATISGRRSRTEDPDAGAAEAAGSAAATW